MNITLGEAKAEARRLLQAGDCARALALYDRILAAVPLDYEARFKIADTLAAAGLADQAAEVYRAVALHDIRTGHPLPAIVAAEVLEGLGRPAAEDAITAIRHLLAETYGHGSPQLARFAVRQSPISPETPVEAPEPDQERPLDEVVGDAHQRALDLSVYAEYQEQFHPLPLFSELSPDSLLAMLESLSVRRLEDGALITRQGDPGTALYLVAAGEVRVFVTGADGTEREIARLFENTLFGEMALLTDQPRSASVAAVGEADVIQVSREALDQLTAQLPAVKQVLDRFARERLIKNLLQTSPLFTPFTKAQQSDLLRRFEGHELEPGTEVIREGEPGQGLFVVLSGELEVVKHDTGGEPVSLARLKTGDIFGEMSLITQQPTSATVRATARTTVLFLARTYVERLGAAIPELQAYFEDVAARRARDNTLRLGAVVPSEIQVHDPSGVLLL